MRLFNIRWWRRICSLFTASKYRKQFHGYYGFQPLNHDKLMFRKMAQAYVEVVLKERASQIIALQKQLDQIVSSPASPTLQMLQDAMSRQATLSSEISDRLIEFSDMRKIADYFSFEAPMVWHFRLLEGGHASRLSGWSAADWLERDQHKSNDISKPRSSVIIK